MKEWFMSWFMSDWTLIIIIIAMALLIIVAVVMQAMFRIEKVGCPRCGKETFIKVPGSGEGIFKVDNDLENRCDRCDYNLNELLEE